MNEKPSRTLLRTPLYNNHVSLGAKMAPFAGYEMPISYSGIIREHEACRKSAAIFDTCHMGEILVVGRASESALENLLTCDVGSIRDGRCRYGMMCNENGGVLDDLVVYRLEPQKFMLVVNASTRHRDVEWIANHLAADAQTEDISDKTAKLDIQGPASVSLINALLGHHIPPIPFFGFVWCAWRGRRILLSRTGYTGEIGFEVYFFDDPADSVGFWNDALEAGATPAGLGARDTLRLEAGLPLYGHELSETRNARDSGCRMAISLAKPFVGRDAVMAGGKERLVGIILHGRSAARQGDAIISPPSGENIGAVTSGSFAPSLGCAVALGYVRAPDAVVGTTVEIAGTRQRLAGSIVSLPFYRGGTARRNIQTFL